MMDRPAPLEPAAPRLVPQIVDMQIHKAFTLDDARGHQNYIDNTLADARTTKTKFEPPGYYGKLTVTG